MQNCGQMASDIYSRLSEKGFEQAEVYLSVLDYQKVNFRNKKITDMKKAINAGYAVRIIEKGRTGFAYSSDLTDQAIDQTINMAQSMLRFMDEDHDSGLPEYVENTATHSLNGYDPKIEQHCAADKIALAEQIETAAYEADHRINNTEEIGVMSGISQTALISTKLPLQVSHSTYIGGYAEVIAQKGDQKEAGSYSQTVASIDRFEAQLIGQTAARRASLLLEAQSIKTQKLNLVLDPSVAVQFLGVMAPMFDAEQVYKGKSLLAGKYDLSVASPLVTLIDDGLLPGGLASLYYDEEGVSTQRTEMLKAGVLKSFLYDNKNARRENRRSTGNCFRPSYKSLPLISPSNLYIQPGTESTQAYLQSTPYALYVFDVMGLHMVNPISGEFSLGAQGVLIEQGKQTTPVKGVMIAGNLLDLLKQVIFVGDDLQFFSSGAYIGSPTLVVKDIMVGS